MPVKRSKSLQADSVRDGGLAIGHLGKWMGIKKLFAVVAVALPVAVGVVFGILWYQGLPLKTARYYREAQDLPAALATVDEYLEEYPDDYDGLSLKAQILCQMGKHKDSYDIYSVIGPATEEDFVCFTESLVALQLWSMAASTTATYTSSDRPPNADIYLWGLISHTNLGNLDAAIESAEQLARIEGNESQGLLFYGELKMRQGARDEAVKAWEQVMKLNPRAEGFHNTPPEVFFENYVNALTAMGRLEDAMSVLDDALAVQDTGNLHFLRGNVLKDLNKMDEAKIEWAKANSEGLHIGAHLALATQLLAEGHPKEAAHIMSRLANVDQIDSRHAFVMNNICEALGDEVNAEKWNQVFQALSREERVENTMNQVMMDNPKNTWSFVFQAYFHAKEGRWDQADRLLKAVEEEFTGENEEEAFLTLRQAVNNRQFTIEVLDAMEKKGIGINQ